MGTEESEELLAYLSVNGNTCTRQVINLSPSLSLSLSLSLSYTEIL